MSTVLHRGFIAAELSKRLASSRYEDAVNVLHEWHQADPEEILDPPERVIWARSEVRAMRLEAFEAAGAIYREALDAWKAHAQRQAMLEAFAPNLLTEQERKSTAIHYLEAPVGLTRLDFTGSDWPWVM